MNIEEITDFLLSEGEIPVATPVKAAGSGSDDPFLSLEEDVVVRQEGEDQGCKKKRRLFEEREGDENDPLPSQYRHIRHSERKVKDYFYTTCSTLYGEGLPLQESLNAVVTVGNGMFGRKWKKYDEKEESFDIDTAPQKRHLLEKLMQIEAQSLC